MEYTIKVSIPDELLAVCNVLCKPETAQLADQLGIQLRSVTPATDVPVYKPMPKHTLADLTTEARRVADFPEKSDKVRAEIKRLGLTKMYDLKAEQYDAFYDFLKSL